MELASFLDSTIGLDILISGVEKAISRFVSYFTTVVAGVSVELALLLESRLVVVLRLIMNDSVDLLQILLLLALDALHKDSISLLGLILDKVDLVLHFG